MDETGFLPREELRQRAAPTEQREGRWMRGEVHDPRAYHLGGIAGHAGLFSTCEDLARYAQMLLGDGQYGGVRVLQPETVRLMTAPVPVSSGLRGLGWDIRTGYSSNRGDLFTPRAFGHGGFTGTTFWVDPGQDLFVVFLGNRLHPDGKGSVNTLAGRIGTIAAAAILPVEEMPNPKKPRNGKP
jgi:CubicO group peptidase (beta-lactamase class C family)